RFLIAFTPQSRLLFKPCALVEWIVQFTEGICEFLSIDVELESLDESRLRAMRFRERGHRKWIVRDEGRFDKMVLDLRGKNFIDDLSHSGTGFERHAHVLRRDAKFVLIHFTDVRAGVFLDRVVHGKAAERRGKLDWSAPAVDSDHACDFHE